MKTVFLGVAAALVLGISGGTAMAQSDICATLGAQLQAMLASGGASGSAVQIQQKQAQLAQAQTAVKQAGCGGIFKLRKPKQCPALIANVDKLRSDIRALERQERSGAVPVAASPQRAALEQQYVAAGCGTPILAAEPQQKKGFFRALIDGDQPLKKRFGRSETGVPRGTYETVCVRTCDGYYFPISYNTDSSNIARDQNACQAMCPGAPAALYVKREPGGDASTLVSLSGQPYTALPTAYRFQREYDKSCSCQAGGVTAGVAPGTPVQPGYPQPGAPMQPGEVVITQPAYPAQGQVVGAPDPVVTGVIAPAPVSGIADPAAVAAPVIPPVPSSEVTATVEPAAPQVTAVPQVPQVPAEPREPDDRNVRVVGPQYLAD